MKCKWISKILGGLLLSLALAGCAASVLTLTYKDNQCTLDGPKNIPYGPFTLNWVLEEDKYLAYGVLLVTLAEGKTLEDLRSLPPILPQFSSQPDWVNVIYFQWNTEPGTYAYAINLKQNALYHGEPFYILCGFRKAGDAEATMFEQLGPFEVK